MKKMVRSRENWSLKKSWMKLFVKTGLSRKKNYKDATLSHVIITCLLMLSLKGVDSDQSISGIARMQRMGEAKLRES